MRWAMLLCALMVSCGDDSAPPAPPSLLAAYVLDPTQLGGCDLGDPRSWGGDFEVADERGNPMYLRCVPDLLNPLDVIRTPAYSYDVQLRVVFSAQVPAGAPSAATPDGGTVPLDSHYEPGGSDFKQGKLGTAPPGPAFVMAPGDGIDHVGLPSGTTTQFCFSQLTTQPSCVGVTTQPFCLGEQTDFTPPLTISHLKAGLTIVLNAPAPNRALSDPHNYEIRFAAPIDPSCFSVAPANPVTPATSLATTVTISDTPPCSIPPAPTTMLLAIKDSLVEQYGVRFCGLLFMLQIMAP